MKTAKDLELSLLLKEKQIQDLKLEKIRLIENGLILRKRINKAIEWCETCYCEITNAIGEKRKMISSENIIDILKGVDKE